MEMKILIIDYRLSNLFILLCVSKQNGSVLRCFLEESFVEYLVVLKDHRDPSLSTLRR